MASGTSAAACRATGTPPTQQAPIGERKMRWPGREPYPGTFHDLFRRGRPSGPPARTRTACPEVAARPGGSLPGHPPQGRAGPEDPGALDGLEDDLPGPAQPGAGPRGLSPGLAGALRPGAGCTNVRDKVKSVRQCPRPGEHRAAARRHGRLTSELPWCCATARPPTTSGATRRPLRASCGPTSRGCSPPTSATSPWSPKRPCCGKASPPTAWSSPSWPARRHRSDALARARLAEADAARWLADPAFGAPPAAGPQPGRGHAAAGLRLRADPEAWYPGPADAVRALTPPCCRRVCPGRWPTASTRPALVTLLTCVTHRRPERRF